VSDLLYPLDSYLYLLIMSEAITGKQFFFLCLFPKKTLDGGHLISILEFDLWKVFISYKIHVLMRGKISISSVFF